MKMFSRGDTTDWSYNMYKITEIFLDTLPSYKTDNLKKRYNEALLKKTDSSLKENEEVMNKTNLRLNQIAFVHR